MSPQQYYHHNSIATTTALHARGRHSNQKLARLVAGLRCFGDQSRQSRRTLTGDEYSWMPRAAVTDKAEPAYHKGGVRQHLEGGCCAHGLKEVGCGCGHPVGHLPHLFHISLCVSCNVTHALCVAYLLTDIWATALSFSINSSYYYCCCCWRCSQRLLLLILKYKSWSTQLISAARCS